MQIMQSQIMSHYTLILGGILYYIDGNTKDPLSAKKKKILTLSMIGNFTCFSYHSFLYHLTFKPCGLSACVVHHL